MSRLMGMLWREAPPTALMAAKLETMLAAVSGPPSWESITTLAGRAGFAWRGRRGGQGIAADPGGVLVLDGVVYNRRDFDHPGTDAQCVAALIAAHGFPGALTRLNGDFALAYFDEGRGALWLGRDRFGVRPLYVARTPQYVAFASRPAVLAGLSGHGLAPRPEYIALFAASHYRTFDNDPEASPYLGVGQVPAGTWLRFDSHGERHGRWWSLAEAPDFGDAAEDLARRYASLLSDAVAIRLARAEHAAFTLSGGMDSSSVLGLAVTASGIKRHAFSSVYADKTFDESDDIRTMLDAAVARWHKVPVEIEDPMPLIREMIEAHDEPVATATWLSHYLICREAAAAGFDALFGGLGGDELNAGEYEYFFYHFADLRYLGDETGLTREIAYWRRHHDHPVYPKSREVAEAGLARLVDPRHPGRCLPDRVRIERYAAALDPDFFNLAAFSPIMDHPFASYLKNRTSQDLFRETAPCCLRAEDRQTARFGLGHFLPFFDHRLAEFMFRVPGEFKIRDGVTKTLLRLAMRGILPEATRTRVKKTGWNAPAHLWFSGKGMEAIRDLTASAAFRGRGIYRLAEVERLLDEHVAIVASGKPAENHMMFLWQLVNLELWLSELDSRGRAVSSRP